MHTTKVVHARGWLQTSRILVLCNSLRSNVNKNNLIDRHKSHGDYILGGTHPLVILGVYCSLVAA